MNTPLDRFTKKARQAFNLAREQAAQFGNNYVGSEHLLLGLIQTQNGMAAQALTALNVDQAVLQQRLAQITSAEKKLTLGKPKLTPRLNRIIDLADDERQGMGHQYIGSEHLLLGLLREDGGQATEVLKSLANPDEIRTKLEEMMSG